MEDRLLTRLMTEEDYAARIDYLGETVTLSVEGQIGSIALTLEEFGNYVRFLDAVLRRLEHDV